MFYTLCSSCKTVWRKGSFSISPFSSCRQVSASSILGAINPRCSRTRNHEACIDGEALLELTRNDSDLLGPDSPRSHGLQATVVSRLHVFEPCNGIGMRDVCGYTPSSGLCRVIHTQEARKRLGNRLSTRSEEYCDLQFEVKSKRGGKASVSRKYCRWKAEYGVREVRWYRFPLPMKRR